jgi:hypothetical protein
MIVQGQFSPPSGLSTKLSRRNAIQNPVYEYAPQNLSLIFWNYSI